MTQRGEPSLSNGSVWWGEATGPSSVAVLRGVDRTSVALLRRVDEPARAYARPTGKTKLSHYPNLSVLATMIFAMLALSLLAWTMDHAVKNAAPPPLQPNNAPSRPSTRPPPNRIVMAVKQEPIQTGSTVASNPNVGSPFGIPDSSSILSIPDNPAIHD